MSSSLNTIAGIYIGANQPREAEKYIVKAIDMARRADNPARLAVLCGTASEVYHALLDDEQALRYADQAYEIDSRLGRGDRAAVPYHLSNKTEKDFETILHVLFDAIGINVDTEVKNAKGRCDVVMRTREYIYVLELKIDGAATVDDALAQIDEKNYLIPYWNDPRPKVKAGVILDRDTRTISDWKVVAG